MLDVNDLPKAGLPPQEGAHVIETQKDRGEVADRITEDRRDDAEAREQKCQHHDELDDRLDDRHDRKDPA